MIGTVLHVNVSRGGIPKRPIASAELTEHGIAGDAWRYPFHGGRRKAILLITSEGIDELVAQGFLLFPGALGENLTTRGLDRRGCAWEIRVGAGAIELQSIRMPCGSLDVSAHTFRRQCSTRASNAATRRRRVGA